MKFQELSHQDMLIEINKIKNNSLELLMGFYHIRLKQKEMALKQDYKINDLSQGAVTMLLQELKQDANIVNAARNNTLRINQSQAFFYNTDDASFKLHININKIGGVNEEVIWNLIKFMIEESESPSNNISFHFKIVAPRFTSELNGADPREKRFCDTDQLTIYFDKYSSLLDLLILAQKIEKKLKDEGIPENIIKFGPKDSFTFNSFVSGRFETNKLNCQYNIFKFFDIEINKFFARHEANSESLKNIPLCAFESVFYAVIINPNIQIVEGELSEADSLVVQQEFSTMMLDPKAHVSALGSEELMNRIRERMDRYEEIRNRIKERSQKIKAALEKIDFNGYLKVLSDKANEFSEKKKRKKPGSSDFLRYKEAEEAALKLHEVLSTEQTKFVRTGDLASFKRECDQGILQARPILSMHRGWNKYLPKFTKAVSSLFTLGIMYLVSEKYGLFRPITKSAELINDISVSVNNLSYG